MVWVPYSDAERHEFATFAAVLQVIRSWYVRIAAESGWAAAAGSWADLDQKSVRAMSEFSDGVELLISGLCHDCSYAAYIQLGALEALYRTNEVILSTAILTRCVTEHCARICWVLGRPDREELQHRLARAILEDIAGAEQAKLTAHRLAGPEEQYYSDLRARWRQLKHEAQCAFPSWRYENGVPEILGYQVPGPEKAVVDMYGYFTPALPAADREGIYAYLSNNVHPTPYVVRELFTSELSETGEPQVRFGGSPDYYPKLMRMTIVPFHFVAGHIIQYHGWPPGWLTELEELIEAALPGIFVGSTPL
jgi:hypothetical protein